MHLFLISLKPIEIRRLQMEQVHKTLRTQKKIIYKTTQMSESVHSFTSEKTLYFGNCYSSELTLKNIAKLSKFLVKKKKDNSDISIIAMLFTFRYQCFEPF